MFWKSMVSCRQTDKGWMGSKAAVSVTLITVMFIIRISTWSSKCYQSSSIAEMRHWAKQAKSNTRSGQVIWWWCCSWTAHIATHSRGGFCCLFVFLTLPVFFFFLFIFGKYHQLSTTWLHFWKRFRVWTTRLKCERGISSVFMSSIISESVDNSNVEPSATAPQRLKFGTSSFDNVLPVIPDSRSDTTQTAHFYDLEDSQQGS